MGQITWQFLTYRSARRRTKDHPRHGESPMILRSPDEIAIHIDLICALQLMIADRLLAALIKRTFVTLAGPRAGIPVQ
jgi:hypothetical protein